MLGVVHRNRLIYAKCTSDLCTLEEETGRSGVHGQSKAQETLSNTLYGKQGLIHPFILIR